MMNTDKRGFASLSRNRLREIAQQGGQAAHRKGAAHEFTVEEARAAGRKGATRSVGIAPIWRRLVARAGRGPRATSALLPARSASPSRWRAPASSGHEGI